MNEEIRIEIEELMEELCADSYKRSKDWNGYQVYKPIYDKPAIIGLPMVVLVKNNSVRISTPEECMEYFEYSQGNDEV